MRYFPLMNLFVRGQRGGGGRLHSSMEQNGEEESMAVGRTSLCSRVHFLVFLIRSTNHHFWAEKPLILSRPPRFPWSDCQSDVLLSKTTLTLMIQKRKKPSPKMPWPFLAPTVSLYTPQKIHCVLNEPRLLLNPRKCPLTRESRRIDEILLGRRGLRGVSPLPFRRRRLLCSLFR